jgi:hypothetical protein
MLHRVNQPIFVMEKYCDIFGVWTEILMYYLGEHCLHRKKSGTEDMTPLKFKFKTMDCVHSSK